MSTSNDYLYYYDLAGRLICQPYHGGVRTKSCKECALRAVCVYRHADHQALRLLWAFTRTTVYHDRLAETCPDYEHKEVQDGTRSA